MGESDMLWEPCGSYDRAKKWQREERRREFGYCRSFARMGETAGCRLSAKNGYDLVVDRVSSSKARSDEDLESRRV